MHRLPSAAGGAALRGFDATTRWAILAAGKGGEGATVPRNSEVWRLRDIYGSRGSQPGLRHPGLPNPTGEGDPDGQADTPDSWPELPRGEPLSGDAAVDDAIELLLSGCLRLAVVGEPGVGKTWLLRALRSRLGSRFACVYLPVPDLPPDEIRAWIAGNDGPLPAHPGTSLEDLAAAYARESAGLVLLVDDANSMPAEIADALDATLVRTGGALRVVLAGLAGDSHFDTALGRFSEPFERIVIVRSPPAERAVAAVAERAAAAVEVAGAVAPDPVPEPEPEGALPPPSLSVVSSVAPTVEPPDGTGAPAGSDAVAVSSSITPDPPGRATDSAWRSRVGGRGSLLAAALVTVTLGLAIGYWSATSRRSTPDRVAPEPTLGRVRNESVVPPVAGVAVPPGLPRADDADSPPGMRGERGEPASEASGPSLAESDSLLPLAPRTPPQPASAPEAVEIAAPVTGERFESSAPEPLATPDPAPSAVLAEATKPLLAVHVNARPWARVTVDGRDLGLTPIGNVPLAEGTHRFRAELSDGRVIERDVHVDADNRQVTFP